MNQKVAFSVLILIISIFLFVPVASAEECSRNPEYERARSVALISVWKLLSIERERRGGNVFVARMIVEEAGGYREVMQVPRGTVLEELVNGDMIRFELIRHFDFGQGITDQDGKSGYFPAECVTEERIPIAGYTKVLRMGDYLLATKRLKSLP